MELMSILVDLRVLDGWMRYGRRGDPRFSKTISSEKQIQHHVIDLSLGVLCSTTRSIQLTRQDRSRLEEPAVLVIVAAATVDGCSHHGWLRHHQRAG